MKCDIDLQNYSYDCGECKLCKPESKKDYPFIKDLINSQNLVENLKVLIEGNTPFKCREPGEGEHENPDIEVYDLLTNQTICRVEAKMLASQAFMKSITTIGLLPKEALVVDEPKFLHYLRCKENDNAMRINRKEIPIFIVWQWLRPCPDMYDTVVFQELSVLNGIYRQTGGRNFRRAVANNDYVNGHRRGVIDKIHFSMKECLPIEHLIPWINSLNT